MTTATVYDKPLKSYANADSVVHAPLSMSKTLRLTLDKNHFLTEHRLMFMVSQNYTVAPASFNVRQVIDRIQVRMKGGNLIDLDGYEFVNVGRMIEGAKYEQVSLAAPLSVAKFCVDLHYENPNAKHDLISGLRSNKLKTFELIITFTDTLGFSGGTIAGMPNQQIALDVGSQYYEEYDDRADIGIALHKQESIRKTFEGAGVKDKIKLETIGVNRFLMLSFYTDNGNGTYTPNESILKKVTFKIGDRMAREYSAFSLKSDTHEKLNGFDQTGVYVIYFGDDDAGWPALQDKSEATLIVESEVGSPAKWVVSVLQDQTIDPQKLNAYEA